MVGVGRGAKVLVHSVDAANGLVAPRWHNKTLSMTVSVAAGIFKLRRRPNIEHRNQPGISALDHLVGPLVHTPPSHSTAIPTHLRLAPFLQSIISCLSSFVNDLVIHPNCTVHAQVWSQLMFILWFALEVENGSTLYTHV